MNARIKTLEGLISSKDDLDLVNAGLKIGDEIEVIKIASNAVAHKTKSGEVVVLYNHQFDAIN